MPKSPFLEAAERCGERLKAIKEKQYAATGRDGVPVEEPAPLHPEEAWAKRFAVHTIRPEREKDARPPLSGFVPPPAGAPRMPRFAEVNSAVEPEKNAAKTPQAGHIGASLGKPGPRRGVFGLFRGRGI